jgi:3-methyladenine DNA glycosylase AlkD
MSADEFVGRLLSLASDGQREQYERTLKSGGDDVIAGVRMGHVFALAKEFADLPPAALETLLESPVHEVRAGALNIMGRQATARRTSPERRRELYELYLRRTDRIDNWDLVDISAHHVVGGHLADRPRDVLYELARSPNRWERRIAIYSTLTFVRAGEVEDTFAIAEILVGDAEETVRKATGSLLRDAGKRDRARLLAFLDRHAATMPRVMLRHAIEHLDKAQRAHYLGLAKAASVTKSGVPDIAG